MAVKFEEAPAQRGRGLEHLRSNIFEANLLCLEETDDAGILFSLGALTRLQGALTENKGR